MRFVLGLSLGIAIGYLAADDFHSFFEAIAPVPHVTSGSAGLSIREIQQ